MKEVFFYKIQYYPFVQHYKLQFRKKYCSEFKILNQKFGRQLYTDIISDKMNWPIVLESIETQINVSDDLYIKLKPEMKKLFISYANDVTDLITVLDFHNVIQNLKSPMIDNLSCIQSLKHFNVSNTIFDEISAETEFSKEMIRMYNNIMSNKLDNDDIDNNNNDVNTNNLVSNIRKSRKRKCNDDTDNKNNNENTKNHYPIIRKSRKGNGKFLSSKNLNKQLNDEKISVH